MAFLAFVFCRLPTLYGRVFLPVRFWRRILYRAIYRRAFAYSKYVAQLDRKHSVVELKATDRRAVRSGAMAWKSPVWEAVYGLFKSAVPFYARIKEHIRRP